MALLGKVDVVAGQGSRGGVLFKPNSHNVEERAWYVSTKQKNNALVEMANTTYLRTLVQSNVPVQMYSITL